MGIADLAAQLGEDAVLGAVAGPAQEPLDEAADQETAKSWGSIRLGAVG